MSEDKIVLMEVNLTKLHRDKMEQCRCLPPGTPPCDANTCPCDTFTLSGHCRCGLFKPVEVEDRVSGRYLKP